MSKPTPKPEASPQDIGIHVKRNSRDPVVYGEKRGTPKVSRSSDFVFVNSAYVGSLNSVNEVRIAQPPVSVIREQYWTCSKWSFAQRIMAIAVGVLSGAVIGLALTVALKQGEPDVIGGIFRSHPAPD